MNWNTGFIGGYLMAFDKTQYDIDYAKAHVKRKFIPFNDQNPEDAELLSWLSGIENVTQYIKRLIRDDMRKGVQDEK